MADPVRDRRASSGGSVWALVLVVAATALLAACGDTANDTGADTAVTAAAETTDTTAAADTTDSAATDSAASDGDELYPDVLGAEARLNPDGSWHIAATLSSPYDTPQRYADAWRVVGPDGTVYGIRELAHDHAGEQPFTRSLSPVAIPDDVTDVTIEGRDQVSGWGGATTSITLDRSGS